MDVFKYLLNPHSLKQLKWQLEQIIGMLKTKEKLGMVNCSDLLWEKNVLFSDQEKLLKFEAEGREFADLINYNNQNSNWKK